MYMKWPSYGHHTHNVTISVVGQIKCSSNDFFWPIDHYIRYLETLASLKINANGLISTSISYCDDMYLCQSG